MHRYKKGDTVYIDFSKCNNIQELTEEDCKQPFIILDCVPESITRERGPAYVISKKCYAEPVRSLYRFLTLEMELVSSNIRLCVRTKI